jgi:hypothetical protein
MQGRGVRSRSRKSTMSWNPTSFRWSSRRHPATFLWLGIVIALLWGLLAFVIVDRTGSVIVDGFQSSGPVAGATGLGALRWPMLGSFMGYDQGWGFHWFGWPWLRSLLLPVLPWRPSTELAIHCGVWALTAFILGREVGRSNGPRCGTAAGLLTLCAPTVLVALQSYRPEIPTALGLAVLAFTWIGESPNAKLLNVLALLVLPTLHPLGSVVPIAFLGISILIKWRMTGFQSASSLLLTKGVWLFLGISIWAAWYILIPGAWQQFRCNLESQRMLVDGLGGGMGTFFKWSLGSRSSIPVIALLLPALIEAFRTLASAADRKACEHSKILASVGLLAAVGFSIAGRNPNVLHLVAILPFASWLTVDFLQRFTGRFGELALPLSVGCLLLVFSAFPAKQLVLLIRHGGISYRSELAALLGSLPDSRRVLVPAALWEAAASSSGGCMERFRFSTFPNIMPRTQRASYESDLMKDIQSGDLLIWDPLQDEAGIFNFVEATALRHQIIRPMEDTAVWERLSYQQITSTYSKGQPRYFELYRKRRDIMPAVLENQH